MFCLRVVAVFLLGIRGIVVDLRSSANDRQDRACTALALTQKQTKERQESKNQVLYRFAQQMFQRRRLCKLLHQTWRRKIPRHRSCIHLRQFNSATSRESI